MDLSKLGIDFTWTYAIVFFAIAAMGAYKLFETYAARRTRERTKRIVETFEAQSADIPRDSH